MEKPLREPHRTHIQTAQPINSVLLAPDQFRAAPADIDDQEFFIAESQPSLHRQIGISRLFLAAEHPDFQSQLLFQAGPDFTTIFGVSKRAGTTRDELFDAKLAAAVEIASQNIQASPLCFRIDSAGAIESLTQSGNFGEIVQDLKPAVICQFNNETENRVSTDIDGGKPFPVHRAKAVSGFVVGLQEAVSVRLIASTIQASISASARRASISFLAFPGTFAGNEAIKPQLTFIG